MKKFLFGILGIFVLTGSLYAGQCYNNIVVQQQKLVAQPVVQYQYVQPQYQVVPQYQVQKVVEFVEVPKVRVVEEVRQQVVVQKQVVKQQVQRVKVVRQPVLQNLRQRLQNRVKTVQQIQITNQY